MDLRTRARSESGFTLMELLLSVIVLGVIAGPLTAAILGGLRATDVAEKGFDDANATTLLGAYFAPDLQNADPAHSGGRVAAGVADCRGVGSVADLVFYTVGGGTVSYDVETVDGAPALTRRKSGTCTRQVIGPNLSAGYALTASGGAPTLHFYCGSLSGSCNGSYDDLKMVTIHLAAANGHVADFRATTRL